MRINVAASHRFHLLDLARELQHLGHDVKFYSYVPKSRCVKYGLNPESCHSVYRLFLPLLVLLAVTGHAWWARALLEYFLDVYVSWVARKCDVFIGLGTVYVKAFRRHKVRSGALTVLEWGSKHVDEQRRILMSVTGKEPQAKIFADRSKRGFDIADFIAVPASHAAKTFVDRGFPSSKLLINPYGVDEEMFFPRGESVSFEYDLIAVGAWSLQKGSDFLVELCTRNNWRLLHVGSLVDIQFPNRENMTHVDPVDQAALVAYYHSAKVLVHPSRQDGLAMVQAQALACGLPVVCSSSSGGIDLLPFLAPGAPQVYEIAALTIEELERNCEIAIRAAESMSSLAYKWHIPEGLLWRGYAKRYENSLAQSLHIGC